MNQEERELVVLERLFENVGVLARARVRAAFERIGSGGWYEEILRENGYRISKPDDNGDEWVYRWQNQLTTHFLMLQASELMTKVSSKYNGVVPKFALEAEIRQVPRWKRAEFRRCLNRAACDLGWYEVGDSEELSHVGLGETSKQVRETILGEMEYLGLTPPIDAESTWVQGICEWWQWRLYVDIVNVNGTTESQKLFREVE